MILVLIIYNCNAAAQVRQVKVQEMFKLSDLRLNIQDVQSVEVLL